MKIHPLQDDSKPHGEIKLIHHGDEASYSFCVNKMSGDMLDWFNDDPPTIGRTIGEIKKLISNIKKKSDQVISEYIKLK
jgi:hypothetical protein